MDGETYVCAGFEGFKMIKYGRSELEPWSLGEYKVTFAPGTLYTLGFHFTLSKSAQQ